MDLSFLNAIDEKQQIIDSVADYLWENPETAFTEFKSAARLCEALREEGFEVEENLADIATAFSGRFGSGKPVIGVLGEFDALSGLGQVEGKTEAMPNGQVCGHGCGHNLLGTGSLAAAFAIKRYLEETGNPGTVIYYGCPGEEGGSGKAFMARDGVFDELDAALCWHPGNETAARVRGGLANYQVLYKFDGKASHAGGAPHLGRSALDACELMNVGVNYLREHVVSDARMHYAYLDCGGTAPNIVQDHAKLLYCVRAPKWSQVKDILERVTNCAKGAALMTGTTMECKLRMGYSDCFQNSVMAEILEEALMEVGAPKWDEADYALAREFVAAYNPVQKQNMLEQIRQNYPADEYEIKQQQPLPTAILKYDKNVSGVDTFSTDVGDVGYVTPTASLSMATQTIGCPGHSWYVTGMCNSSIGDKGIIAAAETMALAAIKAMNRPEALKAAREELIATTGGVYDCPMKGMWGPFTI